MRLKRFFRRIFRKNSSIVFGFRGCGRDSLLELLNFVEVDDET